MQAASENHVRGIAVAEQRVLPDRRAIAIISRSHRRLASSICAGVWLTGVVWVVLHYFFMGEGQFGPRPHPAEMWFLALHGASAFAALWLFGLLWGVHIPAGWKSRRRRWTGTSMFTLATWFIVSGYLLYYLGNEGGMALAAVAHWATGIVSPVVFVLHRYARERSRLKPVAVPVDISQVGRVERSARDGTRP